MIIFVKIVLECLRERTALVSKFFSLFVSLFVSLKASFPTKVYEAKAKRNEN